MMKKIVSLLIVLVVLMAVLPTVLAAEIGSADNPAPAVEKELGEYTYYFMTTDLAAGDDDGYYWTYTAPSAGIICISHYTYSEYTYQITVSYTLNGTAYEAKAVEGGMTTSPVTTYPVSEGQTVTVHVIADKVNGTRPAMSVTVSADVCDGSSTDPVSMIGSSGFRAYVPGGKSIVYLDGKNGGPYSGKSVTVTCTSSTAMANTTITADGKTYTDSDGDGVIKFVWPFLENAAIPTNYPITIKNGSSVSACYTVKVDSGCTHSAAAKVDAKSATCTLEGNSEYWYCSTCGTYFSDASLTKETTLSAVTIAKKSHSATYTEAKAATCTTDGNSAYYKCSSCGGLFTDSACTKSTTSSEVVISAKGHKATSVAAKAATCTEAGNKAYYKCSSCGGYFTDAACTKSTTASAVTIPATGHSTTYTAAKAATCTSPGNIAYWYCSSCKTYFTNSSCTSSTDSVTVAAKGHSAISVAAKAATCTATGTKAHYYCSACGGYFTDSACTKSTTLEELTTAKAAHTLTHYPAKAATCGSNGSIEYWHCSVCDGYWSDADCTKSLSSDTVTEATGHKLTHYSAVPATCTTAGRMEYWCCSACGGYWSDANCTKSISADSVKIAATGHSVRHVAAAGSTCYVTGNVEYWCCTTCGVMWLDEACTKKTTAEEIVVAKAHKLVKVAAVTPSCKTDGNMEYWYCETCKGMWLDNNATQETTGQDVVLKAAHELTHVDAVVPGCETEGNAEYWYCKNCNGVWLDEACTKSSDKQSVKLAAVGHVTTYTAGLEPTCHTYGLEECWYCINCDACWSDEALTQQIDIGTVRIDMLGNPNMLHVEAVPATCWSDGNPEYWYCDKCDGYWLDEACTQALDAADTVIVGAHNMIHVEAVDATCSEEGVVEYWFCGTCGYAWLDEFGYQSVNMSEVTVPVIDHTVVYVGAMPASCTELGNIEHWCCEVCGQVWLDEACTQETTQDAVTVSYAHNLVHVEAIPATCTEYGSAEYWYCADCGGMWSDEACSQSMTVQDIEQPYGDHVDADMNGVCDYCEAKVEIPAETDPTGTDSEKPKSGNTVVIVIAAVVVLAGAGTGAVLFIRKKRLQK